MLPPQHFLAVTPDGCPEEIEAGPFTEERAKDALFAWEMNHGCPARVVVLSEQVEPVAYVWGTRFNDESRPRPYLTRDSFTTAAAARRAMDRGGQNKNETTEVYGLVPAKG